MQMIEYGATELMYASNGRKLMKNSEIEENDIALEMLTWEIHPNILWLGVAQPSSWPRKNKYPLYISELSTL